MSTIFKIDKSETTEERAMKKLISLLAISTLIASPVFAEDEHQHDSSVKGQNDMMNHENMMDMNTHMQKMQKKMTKINAETDQEKHQQLMHEHMQDMHKGMQMMNRDKLEGIDKEKSSNMAMMERMDKMEKRMNMMQMMMEQMIEHESEAQKKPSHKH